MIAFTDGLTELFGKKLPAAKAQGDLRNMEDQHEISRLSRLTAILTHLQSKRILTAAGIAEKFGISKRTAYRDIRALEDAGVPIYTENGKGYSLVEGYALPPVMFTEEEANALITAEQLISRNKDDSLVRHHREAITKVKAVLRYSSKEKAELLGKRVAFMRNFHLDITSNSMSTIQLAITNFKLIRIRYQAKTEVLTERTLEPQALYHTSENWIMIAWCRLRNAFREFRLDRIQHLEVLKEHFEPRDFDMLNYFLGNRDNKY